MPYIVGDLHHIAIADTHCRVGRLHGQLVEPSRVCRTQPIKLCQDLRYRVLVHTHHLQTSSARCCCIPILHNMHVQCSHTLRVLTYGRHIGIVHQ